MICFGRKAKKQRFTIVLLDETDIVHDVESNTMGQEVLQYVFKYLNLMETAYFGLRYVKKSGESRWLDPTKKAVKQLAESTSQTLYFGVRFYASDPCKLQEEITRYHFVLQVKQDILQGRLPITPELGAQLFALSLQSELGDYDSRRHDKHYVSEFHFLPNQTPELEKKVVEIHKSLCGKVPSAVEMKFLEKVKWLDMYGVDLHIVMGEDSVEYVLCLTPSGIVIIKNGAKISNYFWPRITKAFFKGKYFMLRVRNKLNEDTTYAFELASKNACKYLWKCCVEHHAFFRLTQVKDVSGLPVNIFRLGSKHRYSGRTEQQIRMDMKLIQRPPPQVIRMPSRRYPKRLGQPDGAEAEHKEEKPSISVRHKSKAKDDLALRIPVTFAPLYRSVSTPAELSCPDTSKVKSVPWEDPNQKGLFSNSSRYSLCSSHGSERKHKRRSHHRRSSVDSEMSSDYKRNRHRRKSSDNESDVSKSSRGSKASKSSRGSTHHRKSRNVDAESGNNSDTSTKKRGRKHRRHHSGSKCSHDSEMQLKMVEKQQENIWLQSAVVRDLSQRKSGYMNSGIDTESEMMSGHRKKHRRHSRSRSRSPDSKPALSNEVKRHIKYNLVESTGLTEEEKKDIKYTKVETNKDVHKVRSSPSSAGKRRYKLDNVPSRTSLEKVNSRKAEDDPPPPYTPQSSISKFSSNRDGTNAKLQEQVHKKDVSMKSSASCSGVLVSDSSSGSISNALQRRARSDQQCSVINTKDKARNFKHLHGSSVEFSGSGWSSSTENSSYYKFSNGDVHLHGKKSPSAQIRHSAILRSQESSKMPVVSSRKQGDSNQNRQMRPERSASMKTDI